MASRPQRWANIVRRAATVICLAALIIVCVLLPIDLIPDLLSVLGYPDDLLIVREALWIVLWQVPAKFMRE